MQLGEVGICKVVEVEKEEEVEGDNDWIEVQHEGLKSYWCRSA